jgi:hypothetical protein
MHPLKYIIVGLTGLTDLSSDKDNNRKWTVEVGPKG